MQSKNALLDLLSKLLSAQTFTTQEEICQALARKGFHVNQSKISRLLRKVGAIKNLNTNQQIVYTLPSEPPPPTDKYIYSELITAISANESTIVIHTNPGVASMVARALDHHRDTLNLLGTVAGDDTLFVAPKSQQSLLKTVLAIKGFLQIE